MMLSINGLQSLQQPCKIRILSIEQVRVREVSVTCPRPQSQESAEPGFPSILAPACVFTHHYGF